MKDALKLEFLSDVPSWQNMFSFHVVLLLAGEDAPAQSTPSSNEGQTIYLFALFVEVSIKRAFRKV